MWMHTLTHLTLYNVLSLTLEDKLSRSPKKANTKKWSFFPVWRRHWVPFQRTYGSTLTVIWSRVAPCQARKKYAVRMALLTMVDVIWSSLLVAGARWVSRAVKLPKPYSAQVKRCSSRWCVCHHWANTTNAPSMWTVLPNDVWPSLRLEWPDVQQQVYI